MKRGLFIFAFLFSLCIVKAQESIFSNLYYKVDLGLGTRVTDIPFDQAKFGFHLGVDAIKPIKSFCNDKVGTYGLVGLHLVQKGGKQSNDIMDFGSEGNSLSVNQLSIPIHAGATYNFKRCSLFFDFGPYLAFGIGGSNFDGLDRKAIDFGIGFNLGAQFKKFGFGIGYDKGFTNIAEYMVTSSNNVGNLEEGKVYGLKGGAFYMNLSWTFGK